MPHSSRCLPARVAMLLKLYIVRIISEQVLLACGDELSAAYGVPSIRLNNGVMMPIMAFGANLWSPDVCKQATIDALQAGFRNIWSSEIVGTGCQSAQANAMKEASHIVSRENLFLAGTVDTASCSSEQQCYTQTKSQAEMQFKVLGQQTLDMLMLDYPPRSGGCAAIQGQWKAFEEIYAAERVRSIAVSNFDVKHLECILGVKGAIVPAANQVLFSVTQGGESLVKENAQHSINLQAYTPLGGTPPGRASLANHPVLKKIGKNHQKTAAQVALRWIVQQNATVCVASSKMQHLQENNDIFETFRLSEAEMAELNAVGRNRESREL